MSQNSVSKRVKHAPAAAETIEISEDEESKSDQDHKLEAPTRQLPTHILARSTPSISFPVQTLRQQKIFSFGWKPMGSKEVLAALKEHSEAQQEQNEEKKAQFEMKRLLMAQKKRECNTARKRLERERKQAGAKKVGQEVKKVRVFF